MTNKQLIASKRNWLKARVVGYNIYKTTTINIVTEDEMEILRQINTLNMKLLDNWEHNSAKLGMEPKYRREKIEEQLAKNEFISKNL